MLNFIMVMGLPASGKTTLAKNITVDNENTLHISSDETRAGLVSSNDVIDNTAVFSEMMRQVKRGYEDGYTTIIYDATNLNRKHRMATLSALRSIRYTRDLLYKSLVFLAEPLNTCMVRNKSRNANEYVPQEAYNRMLRSFSVPLRSEGWDSISMLPSQCSYIPSITWSKDIDGFEQDNHHHTMTLDEHMRTCEHMVDNEIKEGYLSNKYLQTITKIAALYHDIGKPLTKTYENLKGEQTEEAHYYGHDSVGAYLFLSEYRTLDTRVSDVNMASDIATLIEYHMRPRLVWDKPICKKAYSKDMHLLGGDMVKAIRLLSECDKKAH